MNLVYLFLISFSVLVLMSCDSNSKEVDPLFYQMSSADSIKYSKELHQVLMDEVLEFQRKDSLVSHSGACFLPPPFEDGNILKIEFAKNGDCIVEGEINRLPLSKVVLDFFIKNRNRAEGRYSVSDIDALKFPFYRVKTNQTINAEIAELKKGAEKIQNSTNADPILIEFYKQRVKFHEERLELLQLFKTDSLAFLEELIFVEIKRSDSESAYKEALGEVVHGYSQLRNYECMRYFGEPYFSLFVRAKQRKRSIDISKLEALKTIRPIEIKDYIRTLRVTPQFEEDI